MSRHGFYWSKCNNRDDSFLDLIGVSQKEDADFVLLLNDSVNTIYILQIFLTSAKFDLNKIFLLANFPYYCFMNCEKKIEVF